MLVEEDVWDAGVMAWDDWISSCSLSSKKKLYNNSQ